jgi:hypothetical protein
MPKNNWWVTAPLLGELSLEGGRRRVAPALAMVFEGKDKGHGGTGQALLPVD